MTLSVPLLVALVFLSALLPALAAGRDRRAPGARLGTVGLYVWKDSPDQHAFWNACGIDTLQFCDTHWSLREDRLDAYYARLARDVESARKAGFRVTVLLFSNIAQWKGPAETEPSGTGVLLDPRDPHALANRLDAVERAVRALHGADGFTFLAGDPGGAVGAPFGPLPAGEWVRMAREVRAVVRREAPHATFDVNPWALAYWQVPQLGCGGPEWWLQEDALTRQVIEAPDLLGPDTGLEVAGHAYYRPLALRVLREAGIEPEPVPGPEDVRRLKARGVKRIVAWPYFLLDEADDGDAGSGARRGARSAVRYVHRMVARMRALGMTGIIGSWSYAGHLPCALNTYAFGRFARDARATPERVIDEYARCLASADTWRAVAQALRYIENRSRWESKLPAPDRLPGLRCDLRSAAEGLAALGRVVPRSRPTFALPEPPAAYLDRVRERLRAEEEAESGGPAPAATDGAAPDAAR